MSLFSFNFSSTSTMSIFLSIPSSPILGKIYIGFKPFSSIALYADLWLFLATKTLSPKLTTLLIPAKIPQVLPFTSKKLFLLP